MSAKKRNVHAEAARAVEAVLRERLGLLLSVARARGVHGLVLGAFGCGVFRCDPAVVAKSTRELLLGPFRDAFCKVVFAVLTPNANAPHSKGPGGKGNKGGAKRPGLTRITRRFCVSSSPSPR